MTLRMAANLLKLTVYEALTRRREGSENQAAGKSACEENEIGEEGHV